MNSGDLQRLEHIQLYCEDIAQFIDRFGRDYATFINDRAYFSAVSMCVLQIGELANGLSEEFRVRTKSEIPWNKVRAMRNLLAHAYMTTDESVMWATVTKDIPALLEFCHKALGNERGGDAP